MRLRKMHWVFAGPCTMTALLRMRSLPFCVRWLSYVCAGSERFMCTDWVPRICNPQPGTSRILYFASTLKTSDLSTDLLIGEGISQRLFVVSGRHGSEHSRPFREKALSLSS